MSSQPLKGTIVSALFDSLKEKEKGFTENRTVGILLFSVVLYIFFIDVNLLCLLPSDTFGLDALQLFYGCFMPFLIALIGTRTPYM